MPESDDKLLRDLRAVATQVDPVPDRMLTAAKASYDLRTHDGELAELAYDSAVEFTLVDTRHIGTPRVLTFSAAESRLTIELEVTRARGFVGLLGQLTPSGSAVLEIRDAGSVREVEADELGHFAVEGLSAGPFSLRCTRAAADAVTVTTDWTLI